MSEHRVSMLQSVSAPVPVVFDLLTNPSMLEGFFATQFQLVKNGFPNKHGVGAIRRVRQGLFTVDEEITAYDPNKLMRYRIIRGSPTRCHRGEIRFVAMGRDRCEVHYEISFHSKIPGTGMLLAKAAKKKLHHALVQLAHKAETVWKTDQPTTELNLDKLTLDKLTLQTK